jgi:hypothetical protein
VSRFIAKLSLLEIPDVIDVVRACSAGNAGGILRAAEGGPPEGIMDFTGAAPAELVVRVGKGGMRVDAVGWRLACR